MGDGGKAGAPARAAASRGSLLRARQPDHLRRYIVNSLRGGINHGPYCSPQAALCSGGMVASTSGEQLGLSFGMTSLLIVPGLPGPGIVCVPDIVISLDGARALFSGDPPRGKEGSSRLVALYARHAARWLGIARVRGFAQPRRSSRARRHGRGPAGHLNGVTLRNAPRRLRSPGLACRRVTDRYYLSHADAVRDVS